MRLGYTTGVPIQDYQAAAETIVHFLKLLTSEGKLRLRYRIVAGAGAVDPDGMEAREVYVELSGPDSPLLVERNGELLRAMEHVAAKLIRLESEEHDKVSFDAENFKALRARDLRLRAETAVDQVETESVGEGMQRMLVVFPAGYDRASYTPPPVPQRAAYGERGDRPAGRRADRDRDRGGDRGFCRR
jgi:spoIIIJ-associated protein